MKCDKCGKDLTITDSKIESALNSTDVYSIQTLVCTNNECSIYGGVDLNNPKFIAKIVKNKL